MPPSIQERDAAHAQESAPKKLRAKQRPAISKKRAQSRRPSTKERKLAEAVGINTNEVDTTTEPQQQSLAAQPSNMLMQNAYGYGGGLGGGTMGMPGGMYGGGMMSPYGMGQGPLAGLQQIVFGVQNVVFSLGQAVQILGMNHQALHQMLDAGLQMFDTAIATFHEIRSMDVLEKERETEEQKKRKRRLKAIRWALVAGASWLMYKIIRRLTLSKRRRRLGYEPPSNSSSNNNALGQYSPGLSAGFGNHGGYGGPAYSPYSQYSSPYNGGTMYGQNSGYF